MEDNTYAYIFCKLSIANRYIGLLRIPLHDTGLY